MKHTLMNTIIFPFITAILLAVGVWVICRIYILNEADKIIAEDSPKPLQLLNPEGFHIESRIESKNNSHILPALKKNVKQMKVGDSGYVSYLHVPENSDDFYIDPLEKLHSEKGSNFNNILITLTNSGYLATIPKSENFRRSSNTFKDFEDFGYVKIDVRFEE